jgi:hypothetical protein
MPERRHDSRPSSPDRRSFPRPPLWLNLLLLVIAAATFAYAKHQHNELDDKLAVLFKPATSKNAEADRIRHDLAGLDLTKAQLARELDGRLEYLQSLKAEEFYIAIDTQKKKLYLRFGKDVVRDADVQIGEARTIRGAGGKVWTFVPLKGAFSVAGKEDQYRWQVPMWVYAMKDQPTPTEQPSIPNGLGHYVIALPGSYIIHSPPPAGSPLYGTPKPGSFMVPEADLAAIWPRISKETRVYVF